MFHARFRSLRAATIAAGGTLFVLNLLASSASAQILVGNPFVADTQGWIDPVQARGGLWRASLHNPTVMETSNIVVANPITPLEDDGSYVPTLMIQDDFTTPGTYDYNARLYTNDDDLFGVVFGYQDSDNYFRVGLRNQTPGNLGGTSGLSVQKVIGGVATQLNPSGAGPGVPGLVTQAVIDNRDAIDVRVAVDGSNYEVFFNGVSQASGSDIDLMAGKIGIQSWAQIQDTGASPPWGTEVETVSVTQGANTLYESNLADVSPYKWRQLSMANSDDLRMNATTTGIDNGNFGVDLSNPWIYQQSNGFQYATATAPNIDFLSAAAVVDEPGAASYGDYEMKVRIANRDNDGIGLIVRAQDDDNFYRINFANQGTGAADPSRAPQGMSVQKVRNGAWSELYRDDFAPLFVFTTPGETSGQTPTSGLQDHWWDVSVKAIGNTLQIQVIDNDGNVIDYPVITDAFDPILAGSAGLQSWGSVHGYFMSHGGINTPFLTAINPNTELTLTVDRDDGNITLTNSGTGSLDIQGLTIDSVAGALTPAEWTPITGNYDQGNGTFDPDDPWTIITETEFELDEAEQSGGDGGTLGIGQSLDLGNAWTKSRLEELLVTATLTGGQLLPVNVVYVDGPGGMSYVRSDLNTDGSITAADWDFFYPNMLADLSGMSTLEQVLGGDLDGDGDVDVVDFGLFESDYDDTFGAGAFQNMIAGVPEPSTYGLLMCGLAALMFRFRHNAKRVCRLAIACVAALGIAPKASAVPYDFTTFTVDAFPPSNNFPVPAWDTTQNTASVNSNGDANVFYSPDSVLGKKVVGTLMAGGDDDVVGFVLGYQPGDATFGFGSDYLLIDWKGTDQNFNFVDPAGLFHQDQTLGGLMPAGLALSRVTGLPTADELWQHTDYTIENPSGGVAELARATTLGTTPYNRAGGSHLFEITYTSTNIKVEVDGQLEFDVNGTFPDGRFGLYTAWMGDIQPRPVYSNFEVLDAGFEGMTAVIDRADGDITFRNDGTAVVEFDYYQFDSEGDSLDSDAWNSLHEQNFQSAGAGTHQNWQEAGGSSSSSIAEVFLDGNSTLMGMGSSGDMVSIGEAFNISVRDEDLTFQYRLPSGVILPGNIEFIGEYSAVDGDHNGDGKVDAADYALWRDQDSGNAAGYTDFRQNFGGGSGSGSVQAAVPEPTGLALAACGLVALLATRRIGRRQAAS